MDIQGQPDITRHIIEKAKSIGASLVGSVSLASLKNSPSHQIYGQIAWPVETKSALVLALAHRESEPELDWWGVGGGTVGDRRLQDIAQTLRQYLGEAFNIKTQLLPYQVGRQGIFLKDVAVLAGLGIIGANNLLVTPEFGPRVRLRALFLEVELTPAKPLDFSPCDACDRACWQACPQQAFAAGSYSKPSCSTQMQADEESRTETYIKYCRACELACPVGR